MDKSKNIMLIAVLCIGVGAGSFYGGMTYQKSQAPAFTQAGGRFGTAGGVAGQGMAGGGQRGVFAGNGQGGRPVTGEIVEQDDNSITVELPDGSSKIVMVSSKTEISKPASGKQSDLKRGEQVMAMGTENSDGTFVADSVVLGRFGMRDRAQQP